MLRNAVERNFEIIGEAIERLANLDADTANRIADRRRSVAAAFLCRRHFLTLFHARHLKYPARERCMKIGRNDPCPCRSGRKYKQCCLAVAAEAPDVQTDLQWRRVRRALENYAPTMMRFVQDVYGPLAIDEAWDEFVAWDEDAPSFDPRTPHMQLFLPWFFHLWAPDPYATAIEDAALHDRSPTSVYLEQRGRNLDAVLRRYLEGCLASPLSYHEIVRCDAGRGFLARDTITGAEREVVERSATRTLQAGQILFAQLVPIDGIVMLEATGPFGFPPIRKLEVIELRQKMIRGQPDLFTNDLLRDWDIELRELYLDITGEMLNPTMPDLRNTDGDELLMHRLVFDIESAQGAFESLEHLAIGELHEDLLAGAERNSSGEVLRMQLDWRRRGNRLHSHWDNTVLGSIEIDGKRMTATVNSARRAAAFRKIVSKAMGSRAKLRATEVQAIERALAGAETRATGGRRAQRDRTADEGNDLAHAPEVKARLREFMEDHYEHWVTEKLPALGGRTPLQAVKTPDGRERVEALVSQMEHDARTKEFPVDAEILGRLRERLGLSPGTKVRSNL